MTIMSFGLPELSGKLQGAFKSKTRNVPAKPPLLMGSGHYYLSLSTFVNSVSAKRSGLGQKGLKPCG